MNDFSKEKRTYKTYFRGTLLDISSKMIDNICHKLYGNMKDFILVREPFDFNLNNENVNKYFKNLSSKLENKYIAYIFMPNNESIKNKYVTNALEMKHLYLMEEEINEQ